jgi:phosphohistidine phosphatase SixA
VLSTDDRAVPNSEVDEVTWLPAGRAVDKVSYTHDHGVLADFAARPAQTVPLILLRHAKAVSKSGWKRTDTARPLDDSGRSDAKALADLIACFAPRPRLISSTAARCADTLRPVSQLTGEQVRKEPALYIHGQPSITGEADTAAEVTALVREALAAGEPAVICAHRENLPLLQEAALSALAGHSAPAPGGGAAAGGAPDDVIGQLPKEWDEPLPTAGFWVLNVAPLPPAPESGESAPAGPDQARPEQARAMPAGLVTTPPPSRPWWRRLLAWFAGRGATVGRRRGVDGARREEEDVTAGSNADADEAVAGDARDGDDPVGPLGVLVSADRYDLSES